MTDARRIDLNYGHFGEPIYDWESQDWHFSRNVEDAPELLVLGQARTLIPSQPPTSTKTLTQTSVEQAQNIDKLIRHFPALAPASGFLPPSVEASEANHETSADHDQTLSDRVTFGRALHPGRHPKFPKTVPVVAFVGGAAGELVRVIQLTPVTLGLDTGTSFQFQGELFQPRVQGLWYTSRGPVQQLQFASSNGEPTEWLAVRHGGATSILRIILREDEVPTLYRIPHVPVLGTDVEIRIELEHVVELPVESLGDAFHTDICFNPWQASSEIAVLDQSSRWKVWKIKSVNKHTKVWTLEAKTSGHLIEEAPDDVQDSKEEVETKKYDGWGSLRFVGDGAYLLCPEFGLSKSAEWILDVRPVSARSEFIFIITSSRIFWIHLAFEHFESTEQPQLSAKILLAWRHFRSTEDISLATQVVSLLPNIMVLLYSRFTGLKTLFTLHQAKRFLSSNFNPYLIWIPNHDDFQATHCSTIVLQVLSQKQYSLSAGNERGTSYQENGIEFLRCLILNNDLSLRETYLFTSPRQLLPQTLEAPRSIKRARPPKSSYRVPDHFVIPNGLLDDDAQDWPVQWGRSSSQDVTILSNVKHQVSTPHEDQWTIDFEWLEKYISSSAARLLDVRSQLVLGRLYDDERLSGHRLVTLEEMIGQEVGISDVERSSKALAEFLDSLKTRQPADEVDSVLIYKLTSPSLLPTLYTSLETSLSQVYHSLVESWTTSLAATVPRRTGTATDPLNGLVATQLQLACNGIGRISTGKQSEGESSITGNIRQSTFTLPVRQADSGSDKGQQRLPEQVLARPTALEEEEFVPAATLPTPEPTPSLRSHGSRSSVGESEDSEDTAARTSSPRGRVAMDILSQWSVGQEPDDKEWEASRIQDERDELPKAVAEMRRKRKRRERERMPRAQRTEMEGPSSQPMPPRLVASQDNMPTYGLDSSQPTPVMMSQPQPGRHGGGRMGKKAKKAGFR
ncbi:MAG: hypothetical protein Q9221_000501 [Calogaya cf. arnoldii]